MTRNTKIAIASIATVIAGVGVSFGILFGPVILAGIRGVHLRQRLLCETDHRALLDACRELSARVADGKLEADTYRVRFRSDLEASQFPQAIRTLRPCFVTIHPDGRVRLEMNSKWWSFGVNAYPEGYEKRFPESRFGDHKLLDGLWYYDDQYLYDRDYDKQIDAILQEQGKLNNPEESSMG